MSAKTSTLTIDGQSVELPIKDGSIGPSVIDISPLYKNTGKFTYDQASTASCRSQITYIDGDKGVLLYRGYH